MLPALACLAGVGGLLGGPALHGQSVPEGVRADETITYYDLPGTTLAAVVAALNDSRLEGPDGPPSQGLTSYFIKPEWSVQASGGACRVIRVEVSVDIDILLPRWAAAEERPADERESWRQIEVAIREHEFGHRDLTIEAADALRSRMHGLEARGCGTLDDVIRSTLSVADGRLREAHAILDRETPTRLPVGVVPGVEGSE